MLNPTIAIYPGTFDPITYGHLDIIKRGALIFNKLIIAIAEDNNKKTLFSIQERIKMINKEIESNNLKNVKVVSFKGLLVNFVESVNSKIIIRGLRAVSDFEYEFQLSFMNYKQKPNIETIFLPATKTAHFISSSFAKEISRLGGDLNCLVSENVANNLKTKFQKTQ